MIKNNDILRLITSKICPNTWYSDFACDTLNPVTLQNNNDLAGFTFSYNLRLPLVFIGVYG